MYRDDQDVEAKELYYSKNNNHTSFSSGDHLSYAEACLINKFCEERNLPIAYPDYLQSHK